MERSPLTLSGGMLSCTGCFLLQSREVRQPEEHGAVMIIRRLKKCRHKTNGSIVEAMEPFVKQSGTASVL